MKNLALCLFTACSLSSLLAFSTQSAAQNFYKWVDAKGTTHYTQTPPPKGAKAAGQVKTFAAPPRTHVQERSEEQSSPTQHQQSSEQQNQSNDSNQQQPTQMQTTQPM